MRLKLLFSLILLIAIVTRFYKLGSFPNGLTWDEAAIGYNAYGLLTNHRDEWLHRTPIVFQSFGDYKSPLLIYLTTVPIAMFGLTSFAVRLPIAIAGTGLVIVSFFLTQEILKLVRQRQELVSYAVMLMVAISPWAIHYSRLAFESMLAAFLISFGVYAWFKGRTNAWWLVIGDIALALSLYAYHSAKIVVPILALFLCLTFYKDFLQHKKQLVIGSVLALLVLAPLGYATVFGKANSRALSTTIIGMNTPIQTFFSHMIIQLSPGFLLYGQDLTYRQSTRTEGVLYPLELLLFVIGLIAIIRTKEWHTLWWIPAMFFVGMVPAALGIDVPHSNRALLALPWVQITVGLGVLAICRLSFVKKNKLSFWILLFILFLATGASFVQYMSIYAKTYSSAIALKDFGYGYDDAIAYIRSQESSVSKIYFTNHYGQAYIYLLFFKRLSPIEYQGGGLANYVITDHAYADSRGRSNVLIVGTPDEFPASVVSIKDIKYPDGTIAFRIVKQ